MCQECDELKIKLEKVDVGLRKTVASTSAVLIKQKNRIDDLEKLVLAIVESANTNAIAVMHNISGLQNELTHVHDKVCNRDSIVQLPIHNRLH
jgi:uncharacterized OB-fold protein